MDILGGIFLFILLTTIIYPNYIFFKKLTDNRNKKLKHKIIYFLITVTIPCLIIFLAAAIITSAYLIKQFNLKFDFNNYSSRIIFACIIFPPSILVNIYFFKFYIKRISITKNEIESIGTE
jgi:hypothetical protein